MSGNKKLAKASSNVSEMTTPRSSPSGRLRRIIAGEPDEGRDWRELPALAYLDASSGWLTPVGASIPNDATMEDMEILARAASATEKMTPWLRGDIALAIARMKGELSLDQIKYLAGFLDVSPGRLRNNMGVAKAFPMERRRESLGITHHEVVMSLDESIQNSLLDQAEAEGWTVAHLGRIVNEMYPPVDDSADIPDMRVNNGNRPEPEDVGIYDTPERIYDLKEREEYRDTWNVMAPWARNILLQVFTDMKVPSNSEMLTAHMIAVTTICARMYMEGVLDKGEPKTTVHRIMRALSEGIAMAEGNLIKSGVISI